MEGLAFSPDGKVLACASLDHSIRLLDANTGKELRVLRGHTDHVWTVSYHAGGTVLAYTYEAVVGGKVAAVGGRLLDGAARVIIGQFFKTLARKTGTTGDGLLARALTVLRLRR